LLRLHRPNVVILVVVEGELAGYSVVVDPSSKMDNVGSLWRLDYDIFWLLLLAYNSKNPLIREVVKTYMSFVCEYNTILEALNGLLAVNSGKFLPLLSLRSSNW
jgi:hypothetical protein